MKRKAVRIAIGLALLFAALLLFLHTPIAKRLALARIQTILSEGQRIDLQAESLDYNLFTLVVRFQRLSLKIEGGQVPFLSAEQVELNLAWSSLLHSPLTIQAGEIDRLVLELSRDPQGAWNLPELGASGSGEGPAIRISQLEIANTLLRFREMGSDWNGYLPLDEIDVESSPDRRTKVRVDSQSHGELSRHEQSWRLGPLRLSAQGRGREWTIDRLELPIAGSELRLSGSLGFSSGSTELAATIRMQGDDLSRLFERPNLMRGAVILDAVLSRPQESFLLDGQVRAEELTVQGLGTLDYQSKTHWDTTSLIVSLREIDLRSAHGRLRGEAILDWSPEGLGRFDLALDDGDWAGLSPLVPILRHLKSKLQGRVRGSLPGLNWQAMAIQADLDLKAPASPSGIPLSGRLQARSDPQLLRVNLDAIQVPGSSLSGEVRLQQPYQASSQSLLQGTLLAQLTDLVSSLAPWLDGPEQRVWLDRLHPTGAVEVRGTLGGSWPRPQLDLSASGQDLMLAGIQVDSLTAESALQWASLSLRRLHLIGPWGEATAEGATQGFAPHDPFDLQAEFQRLPAGKILGLLELAGESSGSLSGSLKASGTIADYQADLSLSGQSLEILRHRWRDLMLTARWGEGRAEVIRARLEQQDSQGWLEVTGDYRPDASSYRIAARGEGLNLAWQFGDYPAAGRASFSLDGHGALGSPSLKWQGRIESPDLAGRQPGELRGEVELAGGKVTAHLAFPAQGVTLQGSADLAEPYPFRFEILGDPTDPQTILIPGIGELGVHWKGRIEGESNWRDWLSGRGSAYIEHFSLASQGRQIRNSSPIQAEYLDRRIRLSPASFESGNSSLRLSGTVSVDDLQEGELELAASLATADLRAWWDEPSLSRLDGLLTLEGSISGSRSRWHPMVSWRWEADSLEIPFLSQPFRGVAAHGTLDGDCLEAVSIQAALGSGSLTGGAQGPVSWLRPGLPALKPCPDRPHFNFQAVDLPVEALKGLPGDLNGKFSLRGTGKAEEPGLRGLTVEVDLEGFEIRSEIAELRQDGPARLRLQEGRISSDGVSLFGAGGHMRVAGGLAVPELVLLDIAAEGNLPLADIWGAFFETRTTGRVSFRFTAQGPLQTAEMTGQVRFRNGAFIFPDAGVRISNLESLLEVRPSGFRVASGDGQLNGGILKITGDGGLQGFVPGDLSLSFGFESAYLEYPQGLKTVSDGDLRLRRVGPAMFLDGQVRIVEGAYAQPFRFADLGSFRIGGEQVPGVGQSPLDDLRLDVTLSTVNPISINNNLARLFASTDLQLRGTPQQPVLTGRITIEEGGRLRFQENTYVVEIGQVRFLSDTRIDPWLDIRASTQAGGYDVTLTLSGSAEKPVAHLSSSPPLSEPDILSLLLTGRTLQALPASGVDVARDQALALLSGGLNYQLGEQAQQRLGLSQVRLEPNLISPESNPGTRLTVGKDLTPDLNLIYSANLSDGGDQIYIAEYSLGTRLQVKGVKQSDNTFRFEVAHQVQFGGGSRQSDSAPNITRVRQVDFQGESPIPRDRLQKAFGVQTGDRQSFLEIQKGLERISRLLVEAGHLEARIRLTRRVSEDQVDLTLGLEVGPKVVLDFSSSISKDLRKEVEEIWKQGISDDQRIEEALIAIRRSLAQEGYLRPDLEHDVRFPQEGVKRVELRMEPGLRYARTDLQVEGTTVFESAEIAQWLKEQGDWPTEAFLAPSSVSRQLRQRYQAEGYLRAQVEPPRIAFDDPSRTALVTLRIDEGPLARIRSVRIEGNEFASPERLRSLIGIDEDSPFQAGSLESAAARLREYYRSEAFNQSEISYQAQPVSGDSGGVEVRFEIRENQREIVNEVEVEGVQRTSRAFVQEHLDIRAGDPLVLDRLASSRKRLYDTGAYSFVEMQLQDDSLLAEEGGVREFRVVVKVREVTPYTVRYGGSYDTDRGPGGVIDLTARNWFGSGHLMGLRGRADADLQEMRAFYSRPERGRLRLKTNLVGFLSRDQRSAFTARTYGLSLQQELQLRNKFVLSYGYSLERNRTTNRSSNPVFDVQPSRIGRLSVALARENRDDILDASRGSFSSSSLEFASGALGSERRFAKYFGQYFKYFPLEEPSEEERPRLVFASGVRIGLARRLDSFELIPSERFFAGGGTTVRGFGQDEAGPMDGDGNALGGEALFIWNNELRFPLTRRLDGVAFLDVGNVYFRSSDFDPLDVRKAAGAGLRFRTSFFVLRFDYGYKLDRRAGEPPGAFFFSIGQAF